MRHLARKRVDDILMHSVIGEQAEQHPHVVGQKHGGPIRRIVEVGRGGHDGPL
jgi:hypothetical protein